MEIRIRLTYILQGMSLTEYSNIQNKKYAQENAVVYLWFIKLYDSNDRTVSGQLIERIGKKL